jgi:hypothetical protein
LVFETLSLSIEGQALMTMNSKPRPEPANDIPDLEPPPAPDILPGDPEGVKPVKEPGREKSQRADG